MRRLALLCAAALLAGTVAAPAAPRDLDCLQTVGGVNLQRATVLDMQNALAKRRVTSRQLTQRYLDRIAVFEPVVNALMTTSRTALAQADALDRERRAGRVRGPLHGIPVLLKDNIGTRDMPTTAGSIALAGNIPDHEAFLTTQLKRAGAIILGKANLSEFANWVHLGMPNGYSSLGGQVVNPYNFGDPSGSSSGSGAGGTLALAAAAVGTETSGSILSPSDANGLVGIKPTVGLVSRSGVIPLAQTFDTAGPMTRTVTDAAVMLGAMSGVDPLDFASPASGPYLPANRDYRRFLRRDGLKGKRLGYLAGDFGSETLRTALDDLKRAGATLVPITGGRWNEARLIGLTELSEIFNEFKYGLNEYLLQETVEGFRVKSLTQVIEYNRKHPDKVKYGQNLLETSDMTLGIYDEPTALASRTATVQSSRALVDTTLRADDLHAVIAPGAANANIGAAAGYPTIIVPAGFRDGEAMQNPVGLSFLGTAWSEPSLIGLGYAYEQVSHRRVPPTVDNPDLFPRGCRVPRR